jgi:predicted TPR repeat methyltransferase
MDHYAQAKIWHEEGHLDAAKQAYLSHLKAYPYDEKAHHAIGLLFVQENNLNAAAYHLELAIKTGHVDISLYNHLANVYKKQNKIDAAIHYFQQALALDDTFAKTWNNFANLYYQMNDLSTAKAYYQKAIQYDKNYIDPYVNLALCALQEGEPALAKRYLDEAYAFNHAHPEVCLLLGNLALADKDYETAKNLYEQPLSSGFFKEALINNLSLCYLALKDTLQARMLLEKMLEKFPDHGLMRNNLANLLFDEKLYDEAIQHYYPLLKDAHFKRNAHFNLGIIFMRKRQWENALGHFQLLTAENPEDLEAYINLGTVFLKLGDEVNAIAAYQQALHIEPSNDIAYYRLSTLLPQTLPVKAPTEYVKQLFNDYAERFDIDLMEKLNYRLPQCLYDALELYLPQEPLWVMIDLGCGTGLSGRLLSKHMKHMIGIDLSENMLSLADQKGYYDSLICDDIVAGLKQQHLIADLIIAADVFVYLGALSDIFKAVFDQLSEGGLFAFTVERGTVADYTLAKTGRYQHSKAYIHSLAKEHHFMLIDDQLISLRKQQDYEVIGYLFILKKVSCIL